jgi:hypothetical protein
MGVSFLYLFEPGDIEDHRTAGARRMVLELMTLEVTPTYRGCPLSRYGDLTP